MDELESNVGVQNIKLGHFKSTCEGILQKLQSFLWIRNHQCG